MRSSCFRMPDFFSSLLLILVAIKSEVHYYITSSQNDLCPQDPCLTLSQFAAISSSYFSNETSVSLFFVPGNHSLERMISLSYLRSFVMTKAMPENHGNANVAVREDLVSVRQHLLQ